MPIDRTQLAESLKVAAYESIEEAYEPVPDWWMGIVPEEKSDKAYEKSTTIVGMSDLEEKAEGEDLAQGNIAQGYITYGKNRTFGQQLVFTHEQMADSRDDVISRITNFGPEWWKAYNRTLAKFLATPFNKGGLTAGHAWFDQGISNVVDYSPGNFIYDGKPLFAASGNNHPLKQNSSVTKYNHLGALSLTNDNFVAAYTHMSGTNAVDERGEPITLIPNILMVHPLLEITARQIIESAKVAGSTYNTANVLQNVVEVRTNPYLTDTDAWYLVCSSIPGLILQKREEAQIDVHIDPDNLNTKINVYTRYGARVQNWRPFICANLVTA